MVRWHHGLNGNELKQIGKNREAWQSIVLQRIGHDLATEQQITKAPH